MSRTMTNALIGFVVAVLVSGGMSLIMAASGASGGVETVLLGAVLGGFTFYILSNLSGNRKTVLAGADTRKRALALAAPGDRALLFFVRTGFVAKAAGLDLKVGGGVVAQLRSPQFTCIELAPGRHELTAALAGGAGAQSKPATQSLSLAPGSVTVLHFVMRMGLVKGQVDIETWSVDEARAKLQSIPMVLADGVKA